MTSKYLQKLESLYITYQDFIEWVRVEDNRTLLRRVSGKENLDPKFFVILGAGAYGVVITCLNEDNKCFKFVLKKEGTTSEFDINRKLMERDRYFYSQIIEVIQEEHIVSANIIKETIKCYITLIEYISTGSVIILDENENDFFQNITSIKRFIDMQSEEFLKKLRSAVCLSPIPIDLVYKFSSVCSWVEANRKKWDISQMYVWTMQTADTDACGRYNGEFLLKNEEFVRQMIFFVFFSFYTSLYQNKIYLKDIKPDNILVNFINEEVTETMTLMVDNNVIKFHLKTKFNLKMNDLSFVEEVKSDRSWYKELHYFIVITMRYLNRYKIYNREFNDFAESWLAYCKICTMERYVPQDIYHKSGEDLSLDVLKFKLMRDSYFLSFRKTYDVVPINNFNNYSIY